MLISLAFLLDQEQGQYSQPEAELMLEKISVELCFLLAGL